MKILVINSGSSSLKGTLFDMPAGQVLADGVVERIGEGESILTYAAGGEPVSERCGADNHRQAFEVLTGKLLGDGGVLQDLDEVAAAGHRVVHGGRMSDSVVVDREVLEAIRANSALAPLHNPPNLAGLEAAMQLLPDKPQVAVFDTAFHMTMPPQAYMYAVPYRLYAEHHVRAYGFHGTSHRYVAGRAAQMLGIPLAEANLITLHLGNGCSAAAIENGKSVDTSMGMTPLEGLVMGTRCGDLDPALFYFLTEWLDITAAEVYELFNRQSGLLGLSGVSNDMREVLKAASEGNERAELALGVFAYRLKKYIGAYCAALGRTDAIVFTAGIGENCPEIRRRACEGLEGLGIVLDSERNERAVAREAIISAEGSPVAVLVVPTDEELQIALETYEALQRREKQ